MPSSPVKRPDITTGDPFVRDFDLTLNNPPVTPASVKASVIDRGRNKVLMAAVNCTNVSGSKWLATFPDTETRKLLKTPSDLTSDFIDDVMEFLDEETEYPTAWLEIEATVPGDKITLHSIVTIQKGLIA